MGTNHKGFYGLFGVCALLLSVTASNAQEACGPADENSAILYSSRDTRVMQTHRSSNDGAAGLVWLKRSPNVRGIVGFDLGCLEFPIEEIACANLELTIYDGNPGNSGAWFSAHRMNVPWVEGNGSFNRFRANGQQLGTFSGDGSGTTWDCRVDNDLATSQTSNCGTEDRWLGGEDCNGERCYQMPSTDDAFYDERDQASLFFNVTEDVRTASDDDVSWMVKVRDESTKSGAVKFYTRDGSAFAAATDPNGGVDPYAIAPRLRIERAVGTGPTQIALIEPTGPSQGSTVEVRIEQQGANLGPSASWNNLTTGETGAMELDDQDLWAATIPLAPGTNQVEFTVLNLCGSEVRQVFELQYAQAPECGDGIVNDGEACDDGNTEDGDCCSAICTLEPEGSACVDTDTCNAAGTCSAGACAAPESADDACSSGFLCYEVAETRGGAAFTSQSHVTLEDRLVRREFDVRRPLSLCAPAGLEGQPPSGDQADLLSYEVRRSIGQLKIPIWDDVTIETALGTIVVNVLAPSGLLSPGATQRGGPASSTEAASEQPYLCHRLKVTPASGFTKDQQVRAASTYDDRLYDVKKPQRLCLPTTIDDQATQTPGPDLLCYKVQRAAGEPRHEKVAGELHTTDRFGTVEIDTRTEKEVCLPAAVSGGAVR